MKKIVLNSEGSNYTAVNIGALDKLFEHSIIHPKSGMEVEGKVFLKEATKATGTEISFNYLPPKTELPYFHDHKNNEETYIFLKGYGDFQIDNDCFPISEGFVVRVATGAKRGLRNSSSEEMIYMVIQSKEGSLGQYSSDDGWRTDFNPKWDR